MRWVSAAVIFCLQVLATLAATVPRLEERTTNGNVIIQLFEWTWDSIAAECTNFIGPAGYGYVQVSPPSEHIQGAQWWTDYQVVSYILTSKRGNQSQFSNMITTCHNAGVKVIADTLLNHMAGIDSGTGVAGSSFTHYVYPGIYQYQDFHHCGLTPNDEIVDYTSRAQVQTCQLDNLADLATETDYVRSTLAAYVNDLLSLGIDGLRLDAAKHIAATDIANIISRVGTVGYITQEVIWGAGEAVQPSEYVGIGSVQEFRYTTLVMNSFSSSGINQLQTLDNLGWVASNVANVFVANHDTERNGNSLNYESPSNTYTLATVFSLAHPFGMPTVLSSYSFSTTDDGAPNGGTGTCSGNTGSNGWLCQHRWSPVVGMVGFHNTVGSSSMTNWTTGSSQQIAFGRGALGFVVINNSDSAWSNTFTTSLPNGVYCNVYTGPMSGSSCSGSSYTVSGGTFTVTVAARTAVALHTGAMSASSTSTSSSKSVSSSKTSSSTSKASSSTKTSTSSTAVATTSSASSGSVTITFSVYATTTWGQNIYVTGSISQLGNWTPSSGIALSSASYPTWIGSVTLPVGTTFSYKYTKVDGSTVTWESDPNRSYTVGSSSATINDTWR